MIFKQIFTGAVLFANYENGTAEFLSDSIPTIAIIKVYF